MLLDLKQNPPLSHCFKWCSIDTSTYFSYVFKSRKLQRIKDDVLKFLWNWIQNGKTARGDYLELVELTIMFLGGSKLDSKAFTFKSPGAFHHARWMAKVIYTLKIALFQKQLAKIGFESLDVLDKITSLASFLALFYVKSWCNASLTTDAPVNDLELWNQFETIKKSDPRTIKSFPSLYSQFANSAQEKLERHLWYLAERHVVFSLFSEKTSMVEKTEMWRKLKSFKDKENEGTVGEGIVKMPNLTSATHLKDLIGADSHTLLKLLPGVSNFIEEHPKSWSQHEDYAKVKVIIQNLPAVNDAAERALALVTSIHFSPATPRLSINKNDLATVRHSCRQKLKKHLQQQQQEHKQVFDSSHKKMLKSFKLW